MVVGIQNHNCYYSFSNDDLLNEGADQVLALGAKSIGIYMGPEYGDFYPGINESAETLAELAQTSAYRRLFEKPFSVISIISYAFSGGVSEQNVRGIHGFDVEREYWELRELAEHLLREFDGSGKTFILNNWEGDWLLLGRDDYDAQPLPEAVEAMISWLGARVEAVRDAREAVSFAKGVSVYSAVDFNFLQKTWYGYKTCLSEVIPHVKADLYSYGAWDSMDDPMKVASFLDLIKKYAPDSEAFGSRNVIISAFGFPGRNPDKVNRLRSMLDIYKHWGVPFCFLWQIYDHECDAGSFGTSDSATRHSLRCKGYGLIDPLGRHTPTWHYLNKYVFNAHD